mgnify:CR=1 FL=1
MQNINIFQMCTGWDISGLDDSDHGCSPAFCGHCTFRLWRQKKKSMHLRSFWRKPGCSPYGETFEKRPGDKGYPCRKVNEKLARIQHIQERKAKESLEAKEQMKELISDISHQTRTLSPTRRSIWRSCASRSFPGRRTDSLISWIIRQISWIFSSRVW